jgi:8-oxo-dGTP pyrophosphatase MutT (NUDIX family)
MTAFDRIRHLLDLFRHSGGDDRFGHGRPMRQAAAAVFRGSGDSRELLLITSRDTGRWIVPKGWIEDGENGAEAALREAWEEAGVIGKLVSRSPVGRYRYVKQRPRRGDALCDVDVFLVKLGDEKRDWPEKDERKRKWFPVAEAVGLIDELGLKDVIRSAMQLDEAA